MPKRKRIRDFPDYDFTNINELTIKRPVIINFTFILFIFGCLVPGAVFMYNFIALINPNTDLSNIPSWEHTHVELTADIFLVGSILAFILAILLFIKVLQGFKSKIIIQNGQLIAIKLRSTYSIELEDINKVVEYKTGSTTRGKIVKGIVIELIGGINHIIDTSNFEVRDCFRLIAFLNRIARIENTKLTMKGFYKFRKFSEMDTS